MTIHELLSNPTWINPQIDYLLWIQNMRMNFGPGLDTFFMSLTRFGEMTIPTLIMCLIYWCFDSMAGLYLFSLNGLCVLFAQFFKMIACVYRPWILSDKIHPVQKALMTAGGYSFPSGHSAGVSSSVGGMAYVFRKHKVVCILLILFCILVGFSRHYLGVHTPQDVVVGLGLGLIFVFITAALIKWFEKDKNRYLYFLGIIDVAIILMLYYISYKSYPMDYVNGKLLVNPTRHIYISYLYFGWIMGTLNGVFLCRRFWPFDAKQGGKVLRTIRGVVGLLIAYALMHYVDITYWPYVAGNKTIFTIMCALGFFLTAVYPAICMVIENFVSKRVVQKS